MGLLHVQNLKDKVIAEKKIQKIHSPQLTIVLWTVPFIFQDFHGWQCNSVVDAGSDWAADKEGTGWLMDQTPGWMCLTIKTWMDLTITRDHHLPPTSWMDISATVTADILTPANVHSWTLWKFMKMWLINIFTLNWSIYQS